MINNARKNEQHDKVAVEFDISKGFMKKCSH